MSDQPVAGVPAPETSAGTANPADATPTEHNPTDSSAVSDTPVDEVDHQGSGSGDVDSLPPGNTTADAEAEVDGNGAA